MDAQSDVFDPVSDMGRADAFEARVYLGLDVVLADILVYAAQDPHGAGDGAVEVSAAVSETGASDGVGGEALVTP